MNRLATGLNNSSTLDNNNIRPSSTVLERSVSQCSEMGNNHSALVMVSFDIPYLVDGISSGEFIGAGVVIDKERGYVLVDR